MNSARGPKRSPNWLEERYGASRPTEENITMSIGIIGAGNIGLAFAKTLSRAGIAATVANSRGPDSLKDLLATLSPTIKAARAFDVPIVLSTVGVKLGVNSPTFRSIAEELPGINEIDRSTMNAWEDPAFRSAVEKTGRKRLVFGALWTEICLVYPAISALEDGYEAMFVADAVGGTSQVAHDTGILRLVQAGAIPNTTRATIDEWFRDWSTPQAQKYRDISAWYRSELQPAADVAPNR